MKVKRAFLILLLLTSTALASEYIFSMKVNVKISESKIDISPKSFNLNLQSGTEYVREITIKNYGESREIYFESFIEGETPEMMDVEFHDTFGNTIYSSNKLTIPAGSSDSPAEVKVNVHISADESANGSYTIYIQAKET
ncbi:hypothetical protein Asulf_00140 [Archaeoglobus sulfaticallidus PM70-1]|uniref:CARDB domain-containing protein n=1 Tax=Archaeoglobus sulfaticallidus PM70-1 TaxID=387631 RepID=N0BI91_9EURY|nr:hypothetical protein [Archaeoglobus sulfaticallidus]AGK60176.1 hypothetical protein Asulf_00140 [Archaeoglobus sulfaticallidus PM70-1]